MTDVTDPNRSQPPNKTKVMARNVLHLGLGQIATTLIAIALTAALGRYLGAKDFGIYYTVIIIVGFIHVIVDWGQSNYMTREMARGRPDAAHFVGGAILLQVAGTALTTVLAWGVSQVLGIDERLITLTLLAIVLNIPFQLTYPITYVFQGRDRMDLRTIVNIVAKAVTLAVTLFVLNIGGGLITIFFAQGVGAVAALFVCYYAGRRISVSVSTPRWTECRELLVNGAPLVLFALVIAVHPFVDVLLLTYLASAEVVGWYGGARTMLGTILAPATILAMATYPEISRATSSLPDLRVLIESTSRLLLIVSSLGFAALYLLARLIVTLIYGEQEFEGAIQILQAAAPILPLLFLGFLLANTVMAIGRNKELAAMKLVGVGAGAIVAWFTIPYCQTEFGNGAIGLMIAFGLSECITLIALCVLLPRAALAPSVFIDLLRAYAVACITIYLSTELIQLPQWLLTFCLPLIFGVIALAFGLIRRSDLAVAIDTFRPQSVSNH